MAWFDAENFKEQLMSNQTQAMEQLKSELAKQTRAIIREMIGEMMGAARQIQPVLLQPIDLDAENSGRKQVDNGMENLLTNLTGWHKMDISETVGKIDWAKNITKVVTHV